MSRLRGRKACGARRLRSEGAGLGRRSEGPQGCSAAFPHGEGCRKVPSPGLQSNPLPGLQTRRTLLGGVFTPAPLTPGPARNGQKPLPPDMSGQQPRRDAVLAFKGETLLQLRTTSVMPWMAPEGVTPSKVSPTDRTNAA